MNSAHRKPKSETLGSSDQTLLEEGIAKLRLGLNAEQHEQLFKYGQLIQKWNRVYNLTAIRNNRELITHHLLDSLAVLPEISFALQAENKPEILDVGAGAGLPGLVLAIAQPAWQITLIDTVQKKAAFMQQAIASLGLRNAQAVHGRVEEYQVQKPFNLICSRAFSSIDNFIALSQHLLAENGQFAALKGRVEVDGDVPAGWRIDALHPIEVPFLGEARHLFMIKR
ncbi:16S rRNA (guanine(527)-N(7))-methyltransferase RsmG [Limnobacter parvus]|uniref:Ribosomal RNA small subunit methyltransferase G n=1 Tax=Limnobacter parvus TaxID=2939690 RepID=A0ABT1XKI9_9BURK|nr:16S rRNA (guanine(527)-N(7))-methyltransferase RsmG [Limnobacter parvus]MCR2747376.1 16S rRNA (guanine(527)-N(7))-methyltransferase RsmG [Limnobacter parvus]